MENSASIARSQLASLFFALACVASLAITGCRVGTPLVSTEAAPEVSTVDLGSDYLKSHPPGRVVLLHSGSLLPSEDFKRQLAQSLGMHVRNFQTFELVIPQRLGCQTSLDEILRGTYRENELISIARSYNADAVLLYRVNHFQFYEPMQTSVSAALVDMNESVVTFAVDQSWNAAAQPTCHQFESFVLSHAPTESESHHQLQLQSPASFASFVGYQIASLLDVACRGGQR